MLIDLWNDLPNTWMIHAGFALVAFSYMVRDVLWLRVLALLASGFFIGYALTVTGPPPWHMIGWYALFIALNLGHIVWLVHERQLAHMTPDERRLADLAFPALDVASVKRLLRKGRWKTLEAGSVLTVEGRGCANVYAILEGNVSITVGGVRVAVGQPGQFVGEVGFLSNSAATATATAIATETAPSVRVFTWSRDDLLKAMAGSPALKSTVHAAFGCDLARKMTERNGPVLRGAAEAETAEAEPSGAAGRQEAARPAFQVQEP